MLPEMTVEKNDRLNTAHGLKPFAEYGSADFERQLEDAVELAAAAKKLADGGSQGAWPEKTLEILTRYAPFELHDVKSALAEFGFRDWKSCVRFVKDDNCDDFASIVLRWTQDNKIPHSQNLGFIDGDGTGFKTAYLFELNNKDESLGPRGTLEKAFDAKYFYKMKRPLVVLGERVGDTVARCLVNYVHPGHWSYPAGHGVKFYSVVKVARERWNLSEVQDSKLLTASYVLAMARSGGMVHYPRDNIASGYLSGLSEFSEYGE